MSDYCVVRLADLAVVEDPAPVPLELRGLSDDALADLSWVGEPLSARWVGLGVWPVITDPPPSIPILKAVGDHRLVADAGTRIVRRIQPTEPKTPADWLAEADEARGPAIDRVNREAGEARSRFVTVTIGQEGTYLDKDNEATAFLKDAAPTPAAYPYLYAEAEATGQPVEDVAALVSLTAQAWRPINARIEGLRQGALKAIKDADTPAAVAGVFPIAWPMPG